MKKTKVIIPALGILLLSTAASVTGTVAWFTSSNAVSASGINVQVEKEEGFVISNEGLTDWGVSALASHDGMVPGATDDVQAAFVPTSTKDGQTWAHAQAAEQDAADALEGTYKMLTPAQNASTGVFQGEINTGVNKNIYLLNNFYIKASTTSDLVDVPLYAKITASGNTSNPELDKALRVLVKYGIGDQVNNNTTWTVAHDDAVVFAPFRPESDGAKLTYSVWTGEYQEDNPATADVDESTLRKMESVSAQPTGAVAQLSDKVTIPANNLSNKAVNKFQIQVYAYFEGEDANCFSDNIGATLDTLAITVALGTTNAL